MKFEPVFKAILIFLLITSGCSREKNPLMENNNSGCEASQCHEATILREYPPKGGKHSGHLNTGIICENCHNNYINNAHHSDSVLDTDNESIIVKFDDLSSGTEWDNYSGNCSYIACHGGAPTKINWYSELDQSNEPDIECTICHAAGSSIDPLITGGSGIQGKHSAHTKNTDIRCILCHKDARERATHMNGIYGKTEEESIVKFSGLFNGLEVTLKFDNNSGACENISCHGGTGHVNWYSNSNGCIACHSSGSMIDPVTTNSSGLNGKHTAHVNNAEIACDICHFKYKDQQNHMNGIYGKAEIDKIIYFNSSSNPDFTWDNNSATCSSLNCHGSAYWYTNEPMTCALCHAPGTNIDPEPSGSHYRHLNAGYDCSECHENYRNENTHTNGIINNAANAPGMLNFHDSHNPDGIYDPSASSCSYLYCHGNFPNVNYDGSDINSGNSHSPVWGDPSTAVCGSCHGNNDNNFSSATHGSHTNNNADPIVFNNESKIESCDACHNYGNDNIRTFGSDSTQGSYNTNHHANFSINQAGINSDVNFKDDNADLASKTSPNTLIIAHTSWNEESASCSNSWCHGNFTDGASITGLNATPSWLIPSTAECGTCHVHSHFSFNNRCGRCHDEQPPGTNPIITPYHIDGNIGEP